MMNADFLYDYKRLTGENYKFGLKALINMLVFHHIFIGGEVIKENLLK